MEALGGYALNWYLKFYLTGLIDPGDSVSVGQFDWAVASLKSVRRRPKASLRNCVWKSFRRVQRHKGA